MRPEKMIAKRQRADATKLSSKELQAKNRLESGDLKTDMMEFLSSDEMASLKPVDFDILLHASSGMNQINVARTMKINQKTVLRAWADPNWRRLYLKVTATTLTEAAKNHAIVNQAADRHSIRAMEIMAELMEGKCGEQLFDVPATVRFNAAKEITHQAGHKPKVRLEIEDKRTTEIRMTGTGYAPEDDPFQRYEKEMALIKAEDEFVQMDIEDYESRMSAGIETETEEVL